MVSPRFLKSLIACFASTLAIPSLLGKLSGDRIEELSNLLDESIIEFRISSSDHALEFLTAVDDAISEVISDDDFESLPENIRLESALNAYRMFLCHLHQGDADKAGTCLRKIVGLHELCGVYALHDYDFSQKLTVSINPLLKHGLTIPAKWEDEEFRARERAFVAEFLMEIKSHPQNLGPNK